jgi:hypothetical protein
MLKNILKNIFKFYRALCLTTDPEARVRLPALPDFLGGKKRKTSSGSGRGSTQPREELLDRKVATPV